MIRWLAEKLGRALAAYLERPVSAYYPFATTATDELRAILQPADVLLVEGNQRISAAIKYLTQSTWSHSALYVGDASRAASAGAEPPCLIEADLSDGVIAVPLSKYADYNLRICRPVGLTPDDRRRVIEYAVQSLGMHYDLQNVIDLMRYLLPTPPVPLRWRRRMLALGSGDPTRAICSTLIAQAFQFVRYPILPEVERVEAGGRLDHRAQREILRIRHHSLFAPRDFDLSPYFQTIKPTIERGFDYRTLVWHDQRGATG